MNNIQPDFKAIDAIIEGKTFMPGISVDCVILSFHKGSIKVLLNKAHPNIRWALPGGFIKKTESADEAALRILNLRTSIEDVYLKQFHLFGDTDRIDLEENAKFSKSLGLNEENQKWFNQRFVTVAYYALVKFESYEVISKAIDEEVEWFDLKNIPRLYSDHNKIINKAIETIRMQIGYIPIGFELLPEKFTMPELRTIYETIVGKELDRRNFQRKILSIGYINRLNETRKSGPHKAPQLYSFDKEKYEQASEYGLQIMSWNLHDFSL